MVAAVSIATAASSSAQWKQRTLATTAVWPATTGGLMRSHLTCRSKASCCCCRCKDVNVTHIDNKTAREQWLCFLFITKNYSLRIQNHLTIWENSIFSPKTINTWKATVLHWAMWYLTIISTVRLTYIVLCLCFEAKQLLGYIMLGLAVFNQ